MSQTVWVTGASSGIGRALAVAYLRRGAQVVLSARRPEALATVAADSGRPDAARIVRLDQEDLPGAAAAAAEAWSAFGRIDTLILNGGISQRALAMDTALDVDVRLMTVNYFANVAIVKAILPQLIAQPAASIVVVSSLVGRIGSPYRSGYAASKHALHGFFDSLRAELPGHVSVTMLCPGFVRTDVSVNALTGSGAPLGTMDAAQAQGLSPDRFAGRAIAAIAARRREVYIAGREGWAIPLQRFAPGLFARVLRRARVR